MKNTILLVLASCFLCAGEMQVLASEQIRVSVYPQVNEDNQDTSHWKVLVIVRPETAMVEATPVLHLEGETLNIDSIFPEKADLDPRYWTLFHIELSSSKVTSSMKMRVSLPGQSADDAVRVGLPIGLSLTSSPWEEHYVGVRVKSEEIDRVPQMENWTPLTLPQTWEALGVTWLRTKFRVPQSWSGLTFSVQISAVDDKDVTFFNGKEIGRTDGWDTFRSYKVPAVAIRFGEENELVIAVDNVHAGGGIAKDPILFITEGDEMNSRLFPEVPLQRESQRVSPGKIGETLPFRPMVVREGVLEYEDGGEVALWGLNYYAQSWMQYRSIKASGVDFHTAVDQDFEDFVNSRNPADPNRINVIRIHVFDTEISDADGNLIENDHLDILDYIVYKCHENGIYLWLTPLAWWPSPNQLEGSFSTGIPIAAMTLCPETWQYQRNYIRQFLSHKNKYTNRRLVDEPCLVLFEILNESRYWTLSQLFGMKEPCCQVAVKMRDGVVESDPNKVYRDKVRQHWHSLLPDPSWESAEAWDYYQYHTVRDYIDVIIRAIRETGGKQPVAFHAGVWSSGPPIMQAIADSTCDAVTMCIYPGGLEQTPQADARNLLSTTYDSGWSELLADKARLVYEFDASDTLHQIDLYPAIARHFRNMGVQVACQFQYDSRCTAAVNRDWPTHYLNAIHTPERYVSYLIGGQAFRSLPRGTTIDPKNQEELIFPPAAVNYSQNAAILSGHGLYMQARETNWQPLDFPENPDRIIAVGNTPYYDYSGTGIVDLSITGDTMTIQVFPDVKRLINDKLAGTVEKPLTVLEQNRRPFRLRIPGWDRATVEKLTGNGWEAVSESGKDLTVETGNRYRLTR